MLFHRSTLCVCLLLASCASLEGPAKIGDRLWQDSQRVYGDPGNWGILGSAFATGLFLDSSLGANVEERTAKWFDRTDVIPDRVGDGLDLIGTGSFLLSTSAAWYGWSRWRGDQRSQQSAEALLSSLTITGASTLTLKGLMPDGRPDGSSGGYPSGHSSMAMAAAASLGRSQGWEVGVPAYLVAMAVGLQRLDSRQHDLDDVIGGWALGWVIGWTVTDGHMPEILGGELLPLVDPVHQGFGLAIRWR